MGKHDSKKAENKTGLKVSGEVETRVGSHVATAPLPDRDPMFNSRETVHGQNTQAGMAAATTAAVTYTTAAGPSMTAEGYAVTTHTPLPDAQHPMSTIAGGALRVNDLPVLSQASAYAYAETYPDETTRHTAGFEASLNIHGPAYFRGGARFGTGDQPLVHAEFVGTPGTTELSLGILKTLDRADGPLMNDKISAFTYEKLKPDHSDNAMQATAGLAVNITPTTRLETRFISRPGPSTKDVGDTGRNGLDFITGKSEPPGETSCLTYKDRNWQDRTVCAGPDETYLVEFENINGKNVGVREQVGKIHPDPSVILPQRLDVSVTQMLSGDVKVGLNATLAGSHERVTASMDYTPRGKDGPFVHAEAGVQRAEVSTEGAKKTTPVVNVSTGFRF